MYPLIKKKLEMIIKVSKNRIMISTAAANATDCNHDWNCSAWSANISKWGKGGIPWGGSRIRAHMTIWTATASDYLWIILILIPLTQPLLGGGEVYCHCRFSIISVNLIIGENVLEGMRVIRIIIRVWLVGCLQGVLYEHNWLYTPL